MLTPSAFKDMYRRLSVPLLDGRKIFGVDVHEYRNAKRYFGDGEEEPGDHGISIGMSQGYAALDAKLHQYSLVKGSTYTIRVRPGGELQQTGGGIESPFDPAIIVNSKEIIRPYCGKGSPQEIARVLQLAVGFNLLPATLGGLQTHCRDCIGLDCNGFVGNFFKARGVTSVGPSTRVGDFAHHGRRITNLADVQALDVMVWGTSHISVIDHVKYREFTGDALKRLECTVVESCGSNVLAGDVHTDGLNETVYNFLSVKDGLFHVQRGGGWEQGSSFHSKHQVAVVRYL